MKITSLCLVALLALSGCRLFSDPLPQLWFFTYSQGGETDSLLPPASFLALHKDGTYTSDFGRFSSGTWKFADKTLYLEDHLPNHPNSKILPITEVGPKEMKIDLGGGRTGIFDSQPLPAGKAADDPFSNFNNKWRIPATHKESDNEIKQRLYNHCHRDIAWAHTDNKYKFFISAFQQMENFLR